MHPVLFHLGTFSLPTYGFLIACGYLAAITYILRRAPRAGFNKEDVSNLIFYAALGGMAGAKLFYVFTYWAAFGAGFAERLVYALRTFQYGFVFYGGLLCGAAVFFIYARGKKLPALRAADLFAPALALGHAFGRIGCFSAGCCYGSPSPLSWPGVVFTDPASEVNPAYLGLHLHPTQLYEAAGNFLIFLALNLALSRSLKKGLPAGGVMALYAALYSLERFLIEFLRGDDRGNMHLGLSPAQLISAAVFAAAVVILMRIRKPKPGQNSF